ncbi:feline leukemia virus subgroup C receptor-related protein 2-like protein, partial [Leptotrombidium deliense]
FVPNSENKVEIQHALGVLFVVQASIAFVLFICVVAFFDEKPKTPPSYSQSVVNNLRGDTSIFTYFKDLLNPNIITLLIVFGVNTSFRISFNTLLNQTLMTKLDDTRLVGLTLLLSTALKLIIEYSVSHILDRKHNFKLIICATFTISSALYLGDAFALRTSNIPVIIATSTFLGATLGPNRPTLLNFGAELTYPSPETVINNAMVFCAQVCVIIFTPINSAIITHFGGVVMYIEQCWLMVAIMILTLFIKSNLRRQQQEQERISLIN